MPISWRLMCKFPFSLENQPVGMGKTTVEVLDKGEETPRSPPVSGHPSGDLSCSAPPEISQVNAAVIFVAEYHFFSEAVLVFAAIKFKKS